MNELKPEDYLSKKGELIFYQIVDFLKNTKLESIDAFEISSLAQYLEMFGEAAKRVNEEGYSKPMGVNGYEQVTPHFTTMKDSVDKIMKLCDKYGLNPSSRDKLKIFAVEPEEKDPLSDLFVE